MAGGGILNRLEIDIMQINELMEAMDLAYKYKLPAVVVHQSLFGDAIVYKLKINAQYKLITPINWPKGEIYGSNKLRGTVAESMDADGFEFMLTPNKNETETRNEAIVITQFVKKHLGNHVEVRFVLGCQFNSPENTQTMCKGLLKVETPALVRTDITLKSQQNRTNPETHNILIDSIRQIIGLPIKICGNISSLSAIDKCNRASRFAVSLQQAKDIIKQHGSPGVTNEPTNTIV